MIEVAELAGRIGGDIRITRQQNLVLTGVPESLVAGVSESLAAIGFPVDGGTLRGDAIACTGEPHCNFSVTETKTRMDALVTLLEQRFGRAADGLRLHLDGCPHACAHHWVGDLGFQGTTVRDAEGRRQQAYDIFVRGSLDHTAAIGRPLFRRVPTGDLDAAVVGLVQGWVDARAEGETFRSFCDRATDDELARLAGRESRA
jgi:ferredoxin-nitrite reductase